MDSMTRTVVIDEDEWVDIVLDVEMGVGVKSVSDAYIVEFVIEYGRLVENWVAVVLGKYVVIIAGVVVTPPVDISSCGVVVNIGVVGGMVGRAIIMGGVVEKDTVSDSRCVQ